MTSSCGPYTAGNIRYFRLGSILQTEGKLVMMSFLETYFQGKTFSSYLNERFIKSKLDKLVRRNILRSDQCGLLYPSSGQANLEQLDISLIFMLIRSLHVSLSPSNNVWTTPDNGDLSAEADVTRITLTRNRLWGHIQGIELTEKQLVSEAQSLAMTITRLAKTLANPSMCPLELDRRIQNKLTSNFDPVPDSIETAVGTTDSLGKEFRHCAAKHVATSTTSLQMRRRLSVRIKRFIDPFIIKPKEQPVERNEMLPLKGRSNVSPRQPRSVDSCMTCQVLLKRQRRLSRWSAFHTNRHVDLDHRCLLTGVATLPNGVSIVTDTNHNRIQMFDKNYDLIEEIECPEPRGICAISSDTVVVCLTRSSKLRMYKCRSTLRCVNDVNVSCDGWMYDVKFSNGCAYVLCEKKEMHVVNLAKATEDILRFETERAVEFFDITPSGDKIFLSDGRGIVCVDEIGDELWSYRGTRNRLSTTGVVALRDRIIFAAWEENKLIELSYEGKLLREAGTEEVQSPLALHHNGGRVYITQYMSSLNEDVCREVVVLRN